MLIGGRELAATACRSMRRYVQLHCTCRAPNVRRIVHTTICAHTLNWCIHDMCTYHLILCIVPYDDVCTFTELVHLIRDLEPDLLSATQNGHAHDMIFEDCEVSVRLFRHRPL